METSTLCLFLAQLFLLVFCGLGMWYTNKKTNDKVAAMGLLTKAWKETLRIEDYCDKEKVIAIVKALLYEFEETHGLHHYNAMRLFDPNAGVGQRLYDLHNKMKLMEDYLGVVVVKEPEKVHYSKRTK